ncbi:aspartic peptidase domain-containing protein [Chaetomium tenue]|uniref:Aspartic peptidase domain-containing protein n=1 Tax=Chaetomium tenue TaxID=1854479 RepID=A0ACB7P4L7_9PEZI|nr:aspartic peptidase domain-containing protein [Chaetomium globosum]
MALCFFLSASVLLLALFCHHATALQQAIHDDGCVHLPIVHSTNVAHFSNKRGIQLQLANRSDVAYYAQLSLGTPPQPVFVQLDTGSFELWVNPDCTTVSGGDAVFCQRAGHYESTASSTATSLGTTRTLRYGIGAANISYFTDTISLAGSPMALRDVQFGVATASVDAFSGILGIGYGKGIATRYPNFVDQLREQNATRVKAYTLALGSKDAQEGVIVFGGVDTSKFTGKLTKLPIIPAAQAPDGVPRFWVDMQALSITPPNGVTTVYEGSSMPVFLDSGSTMTLLPANLTTAVARDFGAESPDSNGFYMIDCALTALNGTLDFVFNGVTVKVPYKELTREVASTPPSCFLGIMASDRFTLLGDTFLRSAYTVFDLETDSIWMTQATNCGSSPAALSNIQDLSVVVGACGAGASEDIDTTSSTQFPSTAVEDFESGAIPTSTGSLGPQVSEVAPPDQASPIPENSGPSLRTVGFIWSLGIVGAVHLLAGL